MKTHSAWLSRSRSDGQRASLAIQLQQAYGNNYVKRLIKSAAFQAKLTVSASNDVHEQEADRVADMLSRTVTAQMQRREAKIQSKSLLLRQETPEEEELQMRAADSGPGIVSMPSLPNPSSNRPVRARRWTRSSRPLGLSRSCREAIF